jgi:hypothetical protein
VRLRGGLNSLTLRVGGNKIKNREKVRVKREEEQKTREKRKKNNRDQNCLD